MYLCNLQSTGYRLQVDVQFIYPIYSIYLIKLFGLFLQGLISYSVRKDERKIYVWIHVYFHVYIHVHVWVQVHLYGLVWSGLEDSDGIGIGRWRERETRKTRGGGEIGNDNRAMI